MFQTNKEDKTSGKDIGEVEISNLTDQNSKKWS